MWRGVGLCLVSGVALLLAACGGGSGGNGGGNQPTTPTVSVTPATASITILDSLKVNVTVAGSSSSPTGTITLTSGTYTSPAAALSAGTASLTIPAGSLSPGSATITASYAPDSAGSSIYTSASAHTSVTVTLLTPAVTLTLSSTSINTLQSLSVGVKVAGPSGSATPTGTITLTGGGYTSPSPVTLAAGSADITIPAGGLAAGSDALTATYTPDSAGQTLYSSATGASAAITVSSLLTVNQSTTLAPVSDLLLGMNLASWYNVVANATSINAAFGKAGVMAIRWPGGSWSDIWHWRTSATNLLPYNCTNGTGGTGWGGYSPFSDFVGSIAKGGKYDLALTANYGSNAACDGGGDPTEAAGWVAEAVSEGYPPSHVTVGNENYGSWEFDLHAKPNDATTYANSVIGNNGFYKLIKAASPSTNVGVVVDAGGIQPGVWDNTVLSVAKGSYDFVEFHYYPQYSPPSVTSDTYLVHQAALDFTTNINNLKSELHAAGKDGTPIYVGELGGNAANPGTQSWSITQGLYASQILGEAMNDGISRLTWWIGFGNCLGSANVTGTNPYNNNNAGLYGWQNTWGALSIFSDIDPNCPGAGPIGTMSPTAQAFNLFQNIAVTGESALGTTLIDDANKNIRAYAATHSGGTVLFLINLNQTQSEPVTITLSKTPNGTSSGVTVITYDKKIYDYTNPACETDAGCTYDSTHDYTNAVWAPPTTANLGAQNLPLTLNLTPWSMNVVVIK